MNDLDKLKALLFGHEKKALDAITRRLETPETRSADIADVLPEAIARAKGRDDRLARALAEPIEKSLKESIRRNPAEIADALFPVMGPAIRKAIAEALRSMVQGLNRALDSSLSPRTRFAAWRAGVPLGEYVLQRSVVYRVEQAYLIRGESGLLVASAVQEQVGGRRDEDAVSAMFTAIQDFVKDSFSQGQGSTLETADMGNFTLWAVHGPEAVLVCVIRGVPPPALRTELTAILERIHLRFGDALADFDGDREALAGVDLELEACLGLQGLRDGESAGGRLLSPGLLVLLLASGAAVAWMAWNGYRDRQRLETATATLADVPGIVVTDNELDGGVVRLRGLRDPLADDPQTLLAAAGLDTDRVDIAFAPYQSLEPGFVGRRVQAALAPPDGVTVRVVDGVIALSGAAPAAWIDRVRLVAPALPGIDAVDTSGLKPDDDALLAAAERLLDPPDSVTLRMVDGDLVIVGTAPLDWTRRAATVAASVNGLDRVDVSGLEPTEMAELAVLERQIDGTRIVFDGGQALSVIGQAEVRTLADRARRFGELALALGATPEIVLTGHADGTGTQAQNAAIMIARARAVADELVLAGVPIDWLAAARGPDRSPGGPDPTSRRVDVTATVVGLPPQTGR